MRKKVQIAFGILLILVLLGLAMWHRREPVYRGQSLSSWLQQYNDVQDVAKFVPIDDAIRAIGPNALPRIVSDLERSDATLRIVSKWCSQHQWIRLPTYGEDYWSAPALMALKALGAEAKPIFPDLEKLLENSRTMESASKAFHHIGPSSIPTLEHACRSTNQAVRVQAALLIARLQTSLARMEGYGWHKSPSNKKPVLMVGWASSVEGEQELINKLAEGLHNPDPAIRRANIEAILYQPTSSGLFVLFGDENKPIVQAARQALTQIEAETNTEARHLNK